MACKPLFSGILHFLAFFETFARQARYKMGDYLLSYFFHVYWLTFLAFKQKPFSAGKAFFLSIISTIAPPCAGMKFEIQY